MASTAAHSLGLRGWWLAARPATLPAAVVPVVVGTASAVPLSEVRWGPFLAALLASLLIQAGTNYANDVFDFLKGADTTERLGPPRVTQTGAASPPQVLVATYLAFGAAALIGLYLIAVGGWPILAVGLLSIAAGLAYTGGPWPLGYHGLGDAVVFIFFGLVGVIGSAYLQTGTVPTVSIAASLPVGFLVTAILVVNNLRDLETDRQTGKHTLAVRLGRTGTQAEYVLLVAGAFCVPLLLWLVGAVGPWFWLPWLSAPLAYVLVRSVFRDTGRALNRSLKNGGRLHLLFGLLFAVSLWLG